jgi:hypothetical protein
VWRPGQVQLRGREDTEHNSDDTEDDPQGAAVAPDRPDQRGDRGGSVGDRDDPRRGRARMVGE